jgi:2'-5' RNA ligase
MLLSRIYVLSEMIRRRRQLTLLVPSVAASELEPLRERLDPVQHRLIPAHVTLCREEELSGATIAELAAQLAIVNQPALTLQFGSAERFAGHGVLLPCIAGESSFSRLRSALLRSEDIQPHRAHITLAHPRNPRSPGNIDLACAQCGAPRTIIFATVSLIEQIGDEPWQVWQEWALPGNTSP